MKRRVFGERPVLVVAGLILFFSPSATLAQVLIHGQQVRVTAEVVQGSRIDRPVPIDIPFREFTSDGFRDDWNLGAAISPASAWSTGNQIVRVLGTWPRIEVEFLGFALGEARHTSWFTESNALGEIQNIYSVKFEIPSVATLQLSRRMTFAWQTRNFGVAGGHVLLDLIRFLDDEPVSLSPGPWSLESRPTPSGQLVLPSQTFTRRLKPGRYAVMCSMHAIGRNLPSVQTDFWAWARSTCTFRIVVEAAGALDPGDDLLPEIGITDEPLVEDSGSLGPIPDNLDL